MRRIVLAVIVCSQMIIPAHAWNAYGHRLITRLALNGLPADAPAFLKDEVVQKRIANQSHEVDRWRGWNSNVLGHENKPDHFLDIEDLEQFGLTLETIPQLRNEYIRALAVAKHVHPEKCRPYDAAKDPDRSKEWPGALPHAIVEHYHKLQAAFWQIRILEDVGDPERKFQLEQARENAIYHMGMLSHFVADAAQPLHTTRHFNGWDGDNPNGYTTSKRFHSYIDGGVVAFHEIKDEDVKKGLKFELQVNARDPWNDALKIIRKSYTRMEPLYQLEKSGDLDRDPGKEMIIECLRDGSEWLGVLYAAAWKSSVPNPKQIGDLLLFDEAGPMQPKPWSREDRATTKPATSAPAGGGAGG